MKRLLTLTAYAMLAVIAGAILVGCESSEDSVESGGVDGQSSVSDAASGADAGSDTQADEAVSSTPAVASGSYASHVAAFKAKYGKSDEWEDWMVANSSRYETALRKSGGTPRNITVSFRYETAPIAYNPAWSSESEHMGKLAVMAQGVYTGYTFTFVFNGDTGSSHVNVIAGTAGTTSYASGNNVYLYYETIFNHEFAHTVGIGHHYDSSSSIGSGASMPPGESTCLMDRNSTLFCSGCRTALGIPLNISDASASDAAMSDILARYPPAGSSGSSGSSGWLYGMTPSED